LFTGPPLSSYSSSCQAPRAPWHVPGVTSHVMVSGTMSVGITPPSSLIRTHAPVLNPPRASVTPRSLGLCRLLSAPAGRRTFPVLSLRLFLCVLGPLPRLLLWCLCPFLPTGQRPSRREDPVGAWQKPVQQLQYGTFIEAAVICSCSGPQMCSPPWLLLPQCLTAPSSCGFYIHASFGLLPFRTVDMLTVRFGQLTVEGLTPSKIRSLSGCSPNARLQARRVAGATQERRLFAVACKPLLGGWAPTRVPGLPGDRPPPPTQAPPGPPDAAPSGGP